MGGGGHSVVVGGKLRLVEGVEGWGEKGGKKVDKVGWGSVGEKAW